MSHRNAVVTLSAALVATGTFTVEYPTNTDAGFFSTIGHRIASATNDQYTSPANFTVSFGTSNITFTSVDMAVAINTKLYVELNERGEADGVPSPDRTMLRTQELVPMHIKLGAPDTADANGFVISQDLTTAGVFSTDTTAAAAIAAGALAGTADVPRNVVAAWTTTAVLTVTGTDEYGDVISESSASGTTFTGTKAFKTVTDVTTTVNITALTVGTGVVLGLPVFIEQIQQVQHVYEDGVQLAKDVNLVRVPIELAEVELLAADLISVPCPVAGTIKRMVTMVGIAIGTGGTLTLKVNNTAVDGLSLVVANSAAAGVLDSDTPTAGHASTVVAVDDELEIVPDSAFATTGSLYGYIEIEPSESAKVAEGSVFVVGDNTEPTALTGDVRGTINPKTTPDGSVVMELEIMCSDPAYKGLDNFSA